MFRKMKGLISLFICISILCTVMPITSYAADNVASVSFGESTEYYTTIDAAWEAAVALDTTAENKATIKLLADCEAENALTNTDDYLVLDTNGKTLTGSSLLRMYKSDVKCAIGVDGGSLEITGNGTISGSSSGDFSKAILLISGGKVYADGITIHNIGSVSMTGSNTVHMTGGEFSLLDGYLLTYSEYALDIDGGSAYLYSGKIESTGRMAMCAGSSSYVQICYSDKPLYLVDNEVDNWYVISGTSYTHLEDNVLMDIEYSDNPDGSDSTILKDVTKISTEANTDRNYLKIQTYKLHTITVNATEGGTASSSSAAVKSGESVTLTAAVNDGYNFRGWYEGDTKVCETLEFVVENVTADKSYTAKFTERIQKTSKLFSTDMFFKLNTVLAEDIEFSTPIKIISFVDLNDYDLEGITTSDYSADLDGSVLAWYDEATFTLYIGGYGKIIAGRSLAHAFAGSTDLNRITGLDMLDTSNVTDMEEMFSDCGRDSIEFTLDLGDNFDTSNVTNMKGMFDDCGALTLDLGNK